MKELNKYYVMPRIEAYELENESFIAGSSPKPVKFGNGDSDGSGWTIQKGANSDVSGNGEELI